jgi:predicted TPR repeat methyltransferase
MTLSAEDKDPCPCGSGKTCETCCRAGSEAKAPPEKVLAPTAVERGELVAMLNGGQHAKLERRIHSLLERYPDSAFIWNLLGVSLEMQGKGGLAALQKASALLPEDAEIQNNMGNALSDLGRAGEAEARYRQALVLNPDFFGAYGNLGAMLRTQGKLNEALACFQEQLRLAPGDTVIAHHIAAISGRNTECAPEQYVEKVFDEYAEEFDAHLQQVLRYDAPGKLVALVTGNATPPPEKWNVLDLGCGTGLVGLAIAPFARHLVGVDLSSKMLEKAQARQLYHRLERVELLTMMRSEAASSYDVIVLADVFIYIGKVDDIIAEIKRLLCRGGVVAFSIETLDTALNEGPGQDVQPAYQLRDTGRYAQSVAYMDRLAVENGFIVKAMVGTTLRVEGGKPVNGFLALWET